jgi:hypothetical protein
MSQGLVVNSHAVSRVFHCPSEVGGNFSFLGTLAYRHALIPVLLYPPELWLR